jgi:plasmid stabilization system protein ParE
MTKADVDRLLALPSNERYGIFYVLDGQTIRVIAILHHARSPDHWKRRR